MLYYKFHNFEEFNELFGIQHHNREKSRKNKILLSYIKNRKLLHNAIISGDYHLLHISNMAELKQTMITEIMRSGNSDTHLPYEVNLIKKSYWSASYHTDDYKGICQDQDYHAIRYVTAENGRTLKMKIGKFYRKLILETEFGKTLPEQIVTYLCEEIVQEWQSYTMGCLPQNRLLVNSEFRQIYDSDQCVGDFHSCMVDKEFHSFYENAVDASAAYLENKDGNIIARCIIYNQVKDQHGNVWRLAERQYSTDCNDVLKQTLVDALIRGKYIDGYKKIGAGCNDSRTFMDIDGNSLSHLKFSIECRLDYEDILSYQDSFKNYDIDMRVATNFGKGDIELDTTEGEIKREDEREYDNYHDCYCDEVRIVYYHGHEYTCDCEDLDDFRWVESEEEYHHQDDVYCCDQCEEYILTDNSYYSEITEEYYCCEDCMSKAEQKYKDSNWYYSDYDEEYYEDAEDITTYMYWLSALNRYDQRTISTESLEEQVENGDYHTFEGTTYDEIDENTGLPYSMRLVSATMSEAA